MIKIIKSIINTIRFFVNNIELNLLFEDLSKQLTPKKNNLRLLKKTRNKIIKINNENTLLYPFLKNILSCFDKLICILQKTENKKKALQLKNIQLTDVYNNLTNDYNNLKKTHIELIKKTSIKNFKSNNRIRVFPI